MPRFLRLTAAAGVRLIVAAGLSVGMAAATVLAGPAVPAAADELEAVAQRLGVIVEQYNAAREDLAATRVRAAALTARMRPVSARLAGARDRVGRIAALAYKSGSLTHANVLLRAASPTDFTDRLMVVQQLTRAQNGQVAELTALDGSLTAERHRLDALLRRQGEQERALARAHAEVLSQLTRLSALRRTTTARTDRSARTTPRAFRPPAAVAHQPWAKAVTFAYAQLGKGYRFGGEGPDRYDCSGLAMASWAAAGVRLPHNAARQARAVPRIRRAQLRPGDLVFYYQDRHHVAIYVGDGQVIHAPQSGDPVTLADLDTAPATAYGRPAG